MHEQWSPDRCAHARFSVQIRPDQYLSPDRDDPFVGSGEIVSEEPIRAQDRYCRRHLGGRFAIVENGSAVPMHCAMVAGESPAAYEGFPYIDPETGAYRVLSATQNPRVFEARFGTLPQGTPT